jgi:hypothetical protein
VALAVRAPAEVEEVAGGEAVPGEEGSVSKARKDPARGFRGTWHRETRDECGACMRSARAAAEYGTERAEKECARLRRLLALERRVNRVAMEFIENTAPQQCYAPQTMEEESARVALDKIASLRLAGRKGKGRK